MRTRASRTIPFVSKATGLPLARLATKVMLGKSLDELGVVDPPLGRHVRTALAVVLDADEVPERAQHHREAVGAVVVVVDHQHLDRACVLGKGAVRAGPARLGESGDGRVMPCHERPGAGQAEIVAERFEHRDGTLGGRAPLDPCRHVAPSPELHERKRGVHA